jgi:hypothetical protein
MVNKRLASSIERHPNANFAIILIGTNDALQSTPTNPGENCSGTACNGTFKGYLKTSINALNTAGKTPIILCVPPIFGSADPLSDPRNSVTIAAYNRIIKKQDNNPLTGYTVGPDTFNYYLGGGQDRFTLFYDNLHPDALGYIVLAAMVSNAITGETQLPFVLEDICVKYSAGGACEAPTPYKQDLMESGNTLYVDQTYTLSGSIPVALDGGRWIRTADADLDQANSDYLSFSLSKSSTVYVAYDANAGSLPAWLQPGSGFTDTGTSIQTTSPSAPVLELYQRDYSAGNVTLGGADGVNTGAAANYVVIVK